MLDLNVVSLEKAKIQLKEAHGDIVSLIDSTYGGMAKKCTFIDKDYGAFVSCAYSVIKRGSGHKLRGFKSISKSAKARNANHSQMGKTRLTEKEFKQRLPSFIKFDFSTFTGAHKKMKFIDSEYGEYWMAPYAAFRGQTHPKRGKKREIAKKTFPIEKIKNRLNPHVTILEDTYVNTQTLAKFCDDEIGVFDMLPHNAMKGLRHPNYSRNVLPNGKYVTEYCREFNLKDPTMALEYYNTKGPLFAQKYIENYKTTGSGLEIHFVDILRREGINAVLFNKSSGVKTDNGGWYRPDIKIEQNGKLLYIDVDGLFRHSENQMLEKYIPLGYSAKEINAYHMLKHKKYEKQRISLLQFREDEIETKSEILVSMVKNKLGINAAKIFARETSIKNIAKKQTIDFFEKNHLMGTHKASKDVGLFLNDKLVSVMSYQRQGKGIDISRFCSLRGLNIVGGFSKLLAWVVKTEDPEYIKSFVDLRYSSGVSYILNGFIEKSTNLGWKWTDYKHTFNRLYCRAKMDSRMLSEKEHALELNLSRIYDAGQRLYLKKLK